LQRKEIGVMQPYLSYLLTLWSALRTRVHDLREAPEAGYTTETVLVTALLVVAALTIIAILVAKVISKASAINLG
jgi:hypothetical protein